MTDDNSLIWFDAFDFSTVALRELPRVKKVNLTFKNPADVFQAAADFHNHLSRFLAYWNMDRVDEEAWALAFEWQRTPPLVADYDYAHLHFLALQNRVVETKTAIESIRQNAHFTATLEIIKAHMDELRSRVQFLQTRAANIRLSDQVDRIPKVVTQMLASPIQELVKLVAAGDREKAKLMVDSNSLLHALVVKAESKPAASGQVEFLGINMSQESRDTIKGLVVGVLANGATTLIASGVTTLGG